MANIGCDPVTILIINYHSAKNAGDAALLETGVRQLEAAFPEAKIVVSGNYPDDAFVLSLGVELVPSPAAIIGLSTKDPLVLQVLRMAAGILLGSASALFSRLPIHGRCLPQRWKTLFDAYRQADLIVSIAGNIFVTMGTFGWAYIVAAASVGYALLFRKPFYVLPQSLGPIDRRWERVVIRWLYTRARIVFTRENVSFRVGQNLGIEPDRLRRTPDLAFGFTELVQRDHALAWLANRGIALKSNAVGVTIINRPGARLDSARVERYYSIMAKILSRFIATYDATLYFFPQVTGPTRFEDDRIAARLVIDQMHVTQNVVCIEDPLPPAMLRTLTGFMDMFVATRMHSGVFAVTMGIPTLFIGYLSKTRGIVEDLGVQDCLVDLDELQEDILWHKLEALWLDRTAHHQALEHVVPMLAERTFHVGDQIAQDYHEFRTQASCSTATSGHRYRG